MDQEFQGQNVISENKKIKFLVRSQNFQMITLQPYTKSFLLPINFFKKKKQKKVPC